MLCYQIINAIDDEANVTNNPQIKNFITYLFNITFLKLGSLFNLSTNSSNV
jgi:hypothetical protein